MRAVKEPTEGDGRPPAAPGERARRPQADGPCHLIAVSSSSQAQELNINTNFTLLLRAIAISTWLGVINYLK